MGVGNHYSPVETPVERANRIARENLARQSLANPQMGAGMASAFVGRTEEAVKQLELERTRTETVAAGNQQAIMDAKRNPSGMGKYGVPQTEAERIREDAARQAPSRNLAAHGASDMRSIGIPQSEAERFREEARKQVQNTKLNLQRTSSAEQDHTKFIEEQNKDNKKIYLSHCFLVGCQLAFNVQRKAFYFIQPNFFTKTFTFEAKKHTFYWN